MQVALSESAIIFFCCLGLLVAFLALDRWFRAWSQGPTPSGHSAPLEAEIMTPQEILQEALKLPLSEQESIAIELSYHVLGVLQSLGLEEA